MYFKYWNFLSEEICLMIFLGWNMVYDNASNMYIIMVSVMTTRMTQA